MSKKVIGTPIIPLHFSLDKDSGKNFPSADSEPVPVLGVIRDVSVKADDFKLLRVVLVKECNGYADEAVTFCV